MSPFPRPLVYWDGVKGRVVQSLGWDLRCYPLTNQRTGDTYTLVLPDDLPASRIPCQRQIDPILNRYAEQLGAALVPSLLAR